MGAYLSQPKTDKTSTDEANDYVNVGASAMQGWRNSQEDAHNSILDYDVNTSFFAVYDGHGGAEVSTYSADKLPDFLKNLDEYKAGNFEVALRDAFLGFDQTLLQEDVINVLKLLADSRANEEEYSEDYDEEDLAGLHEESHLALEEVLQRYKSGGVSMVKRNMDDDDDDDEERAGPGPSMPSLKRVSKGEQKPQSPYLRGRRAAAVIADAVNKAVLDPDSKPAGSSTSAAALAAASKANKTGEPEDDSTVSSSSSGASKSLISTNISHVANNLKTNNVVVNNHHDNTAIAANEISNKEAEAEAKSANINQSEHKASISANGEAESTPDSSNIIKDTEQNGGVTSSEGKPNKEQVSTSSSKQEGKIPEKCNHDESTVSGSNEKSGSGKQQNGITETNVPSSSSTSGLLSVGSPVKADLFAISSSTSKVIKKVKRPDIDDDDDDDSTDDDADYDGEENFENEQQTANSSDEEGDDEDEDEEDDDDDEEEEDDDDDQDDDEGDMEDIETTLANEQFCAGMMEEPGKDSGCTAVVALLHGRDLYVANAGDSRCVVCRKGRAIDMSLDHKPEDELESNRILAAGGRVTTDGRVNGGLNLSRAIGDHAYKMNKDLPAEAQMISALPDIKKLIITPDDEFMVLACDGIWNFMSSEDVVEFVRERLQKNDSIQTSKICEELFDKCLAPNTMGDGTGCDNMTAVIVRFKPKLQELPTKINPDETEDVLLEKNEASKAQSSVTEMGSLKRMASSSLDDQQEKSKRLKTECGEATASSTITTTTISSQSSKNSAVTSENASNTPITAESSSSCNNNTSSSTSSLVHTSNSEVSNSQEKSKVASSSSEIDGNNECDSVVMETSEATATASDA